MPSNKTRINLTVDSELNELLDNVARLTGTPKARFVLEILNDVKPMLVELVSALESANEKKDYIPNLARMSALANAKTAIINNEMSEIYSNQLDWVEGDK